MEEKTKDEFTEDGFFITGDIGKIDDDGRLTLFGRSSDMIISGGYNIYPKEIELVIDEIEGIKESAVIGCPESDLGEAVVAILVSDKGIKTIPDDTISEILLKSLANYKCPRKYIWMEDLPRNAMGKVQKKSLRNEHKNIFGVNNEQ
jgi:malonyl-CoA/methylmalonyl-CoA synthetase